MTAVSLLVFFGGPKKSYQYIFGAMLSLLWRSFRMNKQLCFCLCVYRRTFGCYWDVQFDVLLCRSDVRRGWFALLHTATHSASQRLDCYIGYVLVLNSRSVPDVLLSHAIRSVTAHQRLHRNMEMRGTYCMWMLCGESNTSSLNSLYLVASHCKSLLNHVNLNS